MRNMSLAPVPGYCAWEEESHHYQLSELSELSDVSPWWYRDLTWWDDTLCPRGRGLVTPELCHNASWCQYSFVSPLLGHDGQSSHCSQDWGGSLSDYQPRDLSLTAIYSWPWLPPPEHPGLWSPDQHKDHCVVSVLWRCHPGSDGLFTTITHAASLPELSTNNWAAKYFSRACWEMKCCKEMHLNRCIAGEAAIMKRAFLEHLHLHSKQSYLL